MFAPMHATRSIKLTFNCPDLAISLSSISQFSCKILRTWRFYDHFRTDVDAPSRGTDIGTFTPVLASDGGDLASALQSIREIGDGIALNEAIDNAFPGSRLHVDTTPGKFEVMLEKPAMLRPLHSRELSDGTLRYLLLMAALLTPRPPELMVVNEPETSLHPDLLPALAKLLRHYGNQHQLIVVTHSLVILEALREHPQCVHCRLERAFGETELFGVDPFDVPRWQWPAR